MSQLKRYSIVLAWVFVAIPIAAFAQRDTEPTAEPDQAEEQSEAIRSAIEGVQEVFDQIWIPRSRYTNSPHTREAFRGVVSEVRLATVEVRSSGRRVALGGIVGADGWILTKASRIRGPVTCRLKDGREYPAELVGVDEPTDLAMLKVDKQGLPTLALGGREAAADRFVALKTEESDPADGEESAEPADNAEAAEESTDEPSLQAGDWVATVGLTANPVAVGVVSVLPREIEKRSGLLGIRMDLEATKGGSTSVLVETVTKDGAAAEAGMLDGDRIVSIDGAPTRTSQELRDAVMGQNPGDRVEIQVLRGEEKLRLVAILRGWDTMPEWFRSSAQRRAYYQNNLGGKLSERRFGFPSALQHDTQLNPNQCGGPLVDLDGRVVAFNISRSGRTESYALPIELVESRLFDLMSGNLAPPMAE